MDFGVYLPVAGNSVNVFLLVGLGGWSACCRACSASAAGSC